MSQERRARGRVRGGIYRGGEGRFAAQLPRSIAAAETLGGSPLGSTFGTEITTLPVLPMWSRGAAEEARHAVNTDLPKITAERDLFLSLLSLDRQGSVETFVQDALSLIVDTTGAAHGYLEVFDDQLDAPRWWAAHDLSDAQVQDVRDCISRGIIAEAVASGRMVVTPSAMLDPRFNERASVRLGKIEAVLCTPIGDDRVCGVLYLQGRSTPGLFPERDQNTAALFARHLAPAVRRLLAEYTAALERDLTQPHRRTLKLEGLVGRSAALAAVLQQIGLVAASNATVLLTGESGTGKSMLAKMIHENGPRAGQPFVELNCGALPDTLIESELFGALPGSHSTATKKVDGKVTAAEGGTLFLDEVALLSPAAQGKLLQLIQSKQYYPLGSATPVHANVRVIAATNVDLQEAIAERRFREDLFYRLNVLPIRVPTLAERREDISDLARHCCERACASDGLPCLTLSRNALQALEVAPWPGNIRQLENMVEAGAIRAAAERAPQVERRHIFGDSVATPPEAAETRATFQEATRAFQAKLLLDVLDETEWNVVETARRLDLTRSHVYNLIRGFGIERRKPR